MIRLIVGFFIAYGAVGTLETEPSASLLSYALLALVGLAIAAWPVIDGTFEEVN